jgi:hypothetical protein
VTSYRPGDRVRLRRSDGTASEEVWTVNRVNYVLRTEGRPEELRAESSLLPLNWLPEAPEADDGDEP